MKEEKKFKDLIRALNWACVAGVAKVLFDRKIFDRTWKFNEDFSPFIKHYDHIVWTAEKIQKVKIQKFQEQKNRE